MYGARVPNNVNAQIVLSWRNHYVNMFIFISQSTLFSNIIENVNYNEASTRPDENLSALWNIIIICLLKVSYDHLAAVQWIRTLSMECLQFRFLGPQNISPCNRFNTQLSPSLESLNWRYSYSTRGNNYDRKGCLTRGTVSHLRANFHKRVT